MDRWVLRMSGKGQGGRHTLGAQTLLDLCGLHRPQSDWTTLGVYTWLQTRTHLPIHLAWRGHREPLGSLKKASQFAWILAEQTLIE